ncbi:MAG: hypothetical protein ACJKTH_02695 [Patescibacteria group bacterium UBA2163]
MKNVLSILPKLWLFLKGLGTKRAWVAGIVSVLIIASVGFVFFAPNTATDEVTVTEKSPLVTLIPVSEYTQGSQGTVHSGSETIVRAETSGKILSVLTPGTRVSRGTTIARFENASQRAALLQAEGALEAAEASFEKTQSGPRSEKIAILEASFRGAQSGAVNTLLSAYATIDSAIRDTADQMFSNPESTSPNLSLTTSNDQRRINIENQRVFLTQVLTRQATVSSDISTSANLIAELNSAEIETRQTRTFIDALIASLNEAITSSSVTEADIASYKVAATNARTALTSTLSAITSARTALETATQNLEEGVAGAENTELAAAQASVKQAQGAYEVALAAYQKTIVQAGVPGTILSCNASIGDVLSAGNDVCRIKSAQTNSSDTYVLPLSSVKYAPTGAFVFVVTADNTLEAIPVETSLVVAHGITVHGLLGDEFIVTDIRGRKAGETVRIK